MKRARSSSSGSLTGGTGDVNPQYLKIRGQDVGTGGTTDAQISTTSVPNPLAPLNQAYSSSQTRAIVMEILRVRFQFLPFLSNLPAGTGKLAWYKLDHISLQTSLDPYNQYVGGAATMSAGVQFDLLGNHRPETIASKMTRFEAVIIGDVATGTENVNKLENTFDYDIDMTDGDGHGILFGGQTLFLNLASLTTSNGHLTTTQAIYNCVITYRAKSIPLTEYLGMLQSFGV